MRVKAFLIIKILLGLNDKGILAQDENQAVFQALEQSLPLPAFIIESYEMDTPQDKANAARLLGASE